MPKEYKIGRIRNGKLIYVTPIYNFLRGGNWKTGFSGVGRSGGETIEYEIINKDLIDESQPRKTYKFVVVKDKAKIINT